MTFRRGFKNCLERKLINMVEQLYDNFLRGFGFLFDGTIFNYFFKSNRLFHFVLSFHIFYLKEYSEISKQILTYTKI